MSQDYKQDAEDKVGLDAWMNSAQISVYPATTGEIVFTVTCMTSDKRAERYLEVMRRAAPTGRRASVWAGQAHVVLERPDEVRDVWLAVLPTLLEDLHRNHTEMLVAKREGFSSWPFPAGTRR